MILNIEINWQILVVHCDYPDNPLRCFFYVQEWMIEYYEDSKSSEF